MRLVPLLAGMVATASVCSQAAAADHTVAAVEVVGTRQVHEDRVRFLLSTRAGQPLDMQAVADDLKAIERMGPFTNCRSELRFGKGDQANQVTVVFHVTELPYVGAVHFAGLGYFQRSGLEKQLQTKPGTYLNPLLLENDRHALERHFGEKGYRNVVVTVDSPLENGIATVTFTVDLGRQVKVGKVRYPGLPSGVLPRTLDEALINAPQKTYQPEVVTLDQSAVARTLQDLGWLDATVREADRDWFDYVRPDEERRRHGPTLVPDRAFDDRMVLTFPIEAGEPWHLGSVSFVGNTVASEEELRAAFAMRDGAVFRRLEVEAALERARKLISNQGYARVSGFNLLQVDKRPDPDSHRLHLTVHVFEGDLYTVERVDLHGNHRTKDAVVRRAMRIRPGDLWNDDKIDESKRQIMRTGLFKSQPPTPLRLSPRFDEDRPGKVDLVVDLEEDSSGQLRFQIGYSSAYGVFGELGYTERNFDVIKALTFDGWRGAAHILDLNVYWSDERESAGLSLTNPRLMDGPYSLSTSFNRSDSSRLDWDELRNTAAIGIGRTFLDNDVRLNLSYSYSDLRIDDIDDEAPNDALAGEGDYHLNTVTFSQSYDRLDHPRLPTRGFRLNASQAIAGDPMSSSTNYFEWSIKGDLFIPLYTSDLGGVSYLHFSERWKQLEAIGDTERIPFYERYYGGGPAPRHRGFDNNDLGPTEININGQVARVGGTIDSLFTAELSMPLQGTNEGLRVVLFSDIGNVWEEGEEITLSSLRTAVGMGVRFPIQLPVALDFAWLIDPRDGEADSQIHFSLGFFSF